MLASSETVGKNCYTYGFKNREVWKMDSSGDIYLATYLRNLYSATFGSWNWPVDELSLDGCDWWDGALGE